MHFSPPAADPNNPNATSPCAVIQAEMYSRPKPSSGFLAGNLAGFIFVVVVVVTGTLAWIALRDLPRLAARSTFSAFYIAVGVLLFAAAGPPLRHSVALVDANGYPNAPCIFIGAAYLVATSCMAFSFLMRTYVALAMVKHAKLVANFRMAMIDDESETTSATSGGNASQVSGAASSFINYAKRIMAAVMNPDPLPHTGAATATGAATGTALRVTERMLRDSRESTQTRSILLVSFVAFVPMYLTLGLLLGVTPAMHENCGSCELLWEVPIAIFAVTNLYGAFVFRLYLALRHDPDDTFGIRVEFERTIAALMLPFVCGYTLTAVDPNGIQFRFEFSWEWFLIMAGMVVWTLWVPVQIYLALRERKAAEEANLAGTAGGSSDDPATSSSTLLWALRRFARAAVHNVKRRSKSRGQVGAADADAAAVAATAAPRLATREALLDYLDDPEWNAYADKMFVGENLRFLQAVQQWKLYSTEKGFTWTRTKAKQICNTFVALNAPMEINISSSVRRALLAGVARHDIVPFELFDPAIDEIIHLLQTGPFLTFMTEKKKRGELKHPQVRGHGGVGGGSGALASVRQKASNSTLLAPHSPLASVASSSGNVRASGHHP